MTISLNRAAPTTTTVRGEPQAAPNVRTPVLPSLELFAGAGGLALGCELAGFRALATVERDRWACDTIRQNKTEGHSLVRDWNLVEGDVRTHDWAGYGDDVALLSAGPPCQPFSAGGRGLAAEDRRDMFPATADVLASVAPRAFIVENVRGLTRSTFRDYFQYVQLRLSLPEVAPRENETWADHLGRMEREADSLDGPRLRYIVTPTLVDAADYGVPQRRHRVFLVGFRSDIDVPWSFPKPTHSARALVRDQWVSGDYWERNAVPVGARPSAPSAAALRRAAEEDGLIPWRTVRQAIQDLGTPRKQGIAGVRNHRAQPGARSYPGHTGSRMDQPAKALKAGGHGVPGGENMLRHHNGAVRYFTVRESARLQTFPDDYEFHGSWGEAMRQLGNAVPVDLARVVASSVYEALAPRANTNVTGGDQ